MRRSVAVAITLGIAAPLGAAPAFAAMDCTIHTECINDACRPAGGLSALITESGDGFEVELGAGTYYAYETTTIEADGTLSLVSPLGNGRSMLVSIYPDGRGVLTSHIMDEGVLTVVTDLGDCAGDGG